MILFSMVSFFLGLIAAGAEAFWIFTGRVRREAPLWQTASIFAAIVSLLAALIMARNSIGYSVVVTILASAQLIFALGAILVSATRWKPLVEGLSAAALSIFSVLTGFSIGMLLTPFAAALGAVALDHAGRATHSVRQ